MSLDRVYCPKCGQISIPGAEHCRQCGTDLREDAANRIIYRGGGHFILGGKGSSILVIDLGYFVSFVLNEDEDLRSGLRRFVIVTETPIKLTKALHYLLGVEEDSFRKFFDQSIGFGRVEVNSGIFKLIFYKMGTTPRFEVKLERSEVMRLVNRLDLLPTPVEAKVKK